MKRSTLDDGRQYAFTNHALERLVEMELPAHHAYLTLSNPDDIVESRTHAGAHNYRRGDLTLGVVVEDGCLVVITALYSNGRAWALAEKEGRLGAGRSYRPGQSLPGGAA